MAKNSQDVLDKLQEQNEGTSQQHDNPENPTPTPNGETGGNGKSVFSKFDNYKPNDGEDKLYHVAIAKVHYSEQTGEYDGQTPYVQKFIKREYDNFMQHAKALGYSTKLLYSPINA